MSKIIVGMSGGVDSAVTAYLLKSAGHDVIGVTLKTWLSADGKESRCCEIDDAEKVASKIGIPYFVVNCVSDFRKLITEPFIDDYLSGVTPNPCVICNRYIKWDKMMESISVMGADCIATGHYATVVKKENGRYTVKKADFAAKDQTYMLYRLTQDQLAKTIMPLGKLSKDEVRGIAEKAELPVAGKADSQEICFVTDGNYVDYIAEYSDRPLPLEGNFVDEKGNVIGRHKGIIHYTVGQRKGLGIALGYPAFIKEIRADENVIVIADEKSIYSREIICKDLNFLSIPKPEIGKPVECRVKVRYHHPGLPATVTMTNDNLAKVVFDDPVKAAAPGQSAVFYDSDDCVVGGGIISEVIY